jgi:hypothetical protein
LPAPFAASDPFVRWSLHTIIRLIERVKAEHPHISALNWGRHHDTDRPEPAPDHQIDPGELWGVELNHLLYQQLVADYPDLAAELAHLSFREALWFVYTHAFRDT